MNVMVPFTISDEGIGKIGDLVEDIVLNRMETIENRKVKNYMNKKEASEYLGVSYQTLKKFIEKGLPIVEVSGVNMIRRVDIDEFMNANKK